MGGGGFLVEDEQIGTALCVRLAALEPLGLW